MSPNQISPCATPSANSSARRRMKRRAKCAPRRRALSSCTEKPIPKRSENSEKNLPRTRNSQSTVRPRSMPRTSRPARWLAARYSYPEKVGTCETRIPSSAKPRSASSTSARSLSAIGAAGSESFMARWLACARLPENAAPLGRPHHGRLGLAREGLLELRHVGQRPDHPEPGGGVWIRLHHLTL